MTRERVAPHDLEAERSTLGAVLVSNELFGFAAAYVRQEDFFRSGHGCTWAAIERLSRRGDPIDPVTLCAELRRAGELETAGGAAYVANLADGVPRSVNVEAYARRVAQHALARARLAKNTLEREAIYAGLDDDETASSLSDAQTTVAGLEARLTASAALDAEGQLVALDQELAADAGHRVTLSLPAIDRVIEGVKPGEVLGILARPGTGKTLVLCHALCGMVSWHAAACYSLEMRAGQIVRRLARMAFGLSGHRLAVLDRDAYRTAFSQLTLDATPGLSVAQMEARTKLLLSRGVPVRAVCIDHLGLIGGDRSMSTYDRVSTQARELKELAKRLEVAVILLIQVNRDAGGDGSRELHLGSSRDSGVIEEACDYMVGMRRLDRSTTLRQADRERYQDVLFLKVLKHRHGNPTIQEVAYRINQTSLALEEAPDVRIDAEDIAAIAARVGGRR